MPAALGPHEGSGLAGRARPDRVQPLYAHELSRAGRELELFSESLATVAAPLQAAGSELHGNNTSHSRGDSVVRKGKRLLQCNRPVAGGYRLE